MEWTTCIRRDYNNNDDDDDITKQNFFFNENIENNVQTR